MLVLGLCVSGVHIHCSHCEDVGFSIDSVSVVKSIFSYVRIIITEKAPGGLISVGVAN